MFPHTPQLTATLHRNMAYLQKFLLPHVQLLRKKLQHNKRVRNTVGRDRDSKIHLKQTLA